MMSWDGPNRRGKVINSNVPNSETKPEKSVDKEAGDQQPTQKEDLASVEEKSPLSPPSATIDPLLDLNSKAQGSKALRRSKDMSSDPPYVSLSGGQMQRVAISRAFMRADQATLVVLDEPSASLDARAEHELFQRIHALSRGASEETRTTIYISHRFSTVRRADKIAVVEDGTITEFGSHKQLMDLDGRYAEFFNLQVKAFSEE